MTHENAASFACPESVFLSPFSSLHRAVTSVFLRSSTSFAAALSPPSPRPSLFHSSRLIYAKWPPAVINRDYGHVLRKLVSTSVLGRPYRDSISSILVAHALRPHPPAFLAPLFLFPSCFLSFSRDHTRLSEPLQSQSQLRRAEQRPVSNRIAAADSPRSCLMTPNERQG